MGIVRRESSRRTSRGNAGVIMAKNNTRKALTHEESINEMMEQSGLTTAQLDQAFEALCKIVMREMRKNGSGELTVARLFKLRCIRQPRVLSQKIVHPKTGKLVMIKGRLAKTSHRMLALKKLKDLVEL
jgi:nucleoid DNA-binding protein